MSDATTDARPARSRGVGLLVAGGLALGLIATGCNGSGTSADNAAKTQSSAGVATAAGADHGPDALPNGISVEGKGEVEGKPDTLTVTFGVSVKRDSVDQAVGDAADEATAMIAAVKASGVEEKDIQTRDYRIQQEFTYPINAQPVPDGFRVTNTLVMKIRTLDKAGEVIDGATKAGGNDATLQGVSFSLEKDETALASAREKAFNDAKARAEQYAKLSGQELGKAQAISDILVTPSPLAYTGAAYDQAEGAGGARASTPVETGQVTTAVTVKVRFVFA